jgi:hypothetical protein
MHEISTGLYSRNHPSAKFGGLKMIQSAESADSEATKSSHVVRIDTIVFHMDHMNYELTIAFYWATDAQSSNKFSIELINQKTGAGCKILVTMLVRQVIA